MKRLLSATLVFCLGLWWPADETLADSMAGGGVSSSGSQPWIGGHNNMPRQTLSPVGTVFTPPTSFGNFWILNNAPNQTVACPPDVADGDSMNFHFQYGAGAPYSPAISFANCYAWTTGVQPTWSEVPTQSDSAFCQSMNPPDVTGASFVCAPQLNAKPSSAAPAAPVFTSHVGARGIGSGATTSSLNTTVGSPNLFVLIAHCDGATPTVSASPSAGIWLVAAGPVTASTDRIEIFYIFNPTANASQTFSDVCGTGGGAVEFMAFSGATTSPLDQVNTNFSATGVTSLTTGSITPTQANELIVTGVGIQQTNLTITVPSGFSVGDTNPGANGEAFASASAYQIQSAATAVNPSWSWTGGSNSVPAAAAAASFK